MSAKRTADISIHLSAKLATHFPNLREPSISQMQQPPIGPSLVLCPLSLDAVVHFSAQPSTYLFFISTDTNVLVPQHSQLLSHLIRFLCCVQCSGSVTCWYGSGCGSGSLDPYLCPDADVDPYQNLQRLLGCKNSISSYFLMFYQMKFKSFKFVKICLMIKIKFFQPESFCINFFFCNHYCSPFNTFMRIRIR